MNTTQKFNLSIALLCFCTGLICLSFNQELTLEIRLWGSALSFLASATNLFCAL